MVTLKWWLENVNGAKIDADGHYGYQCWDLWADYAYRVIGVPKNVGWDATYTSYAGAGPHPGKSDYACNVFHNFHRNAVLKQHFTKVAAGQPAQVGDVAFWDISRAYPGSHVAIVTENHAHTLKCMSQNNVPSQHGLTPSGYMTLTKSGLLGYLRPKTSNGSGSGSATDTEEEELMAAKDDIIKAIETHARQAGVPYQIVYTNRPGHSLVTPMGSTGIWWDDVKPIRRVLTALDYNRRDAASSRNTLSIAYSNDGPSYKDLQVFDLYLRAIANDRGVGDPKTRK